MLSESVVPSWKESKLIHQLGRAPLCIFYKSDLRITSYEPRTSLTSLFLQVQIFLNAKLAPLARHVFFFFFFYGLTLACERSHLVTFSAVYWTTNEYPETVFVCNIEAVATSSWSFYNVVGFKRQQQKYSLGVKLPSILVTN